MMRYHVVLLALFTTATVRAGKTKPQQVGSVTVETREPKDSRSSAKKLWLVIRYLAKAIRDKD